MPVPGFEASAAHPLIDRGGSVVPRFAIRHSSIFDVPSRGWPMDEGEEASRAGPACFLCVFSQPTYAQP